MREAFVGMVGKAECRAPFDPPDRGTRGLAAHRDSNHAGTTGVRGLRPDRSRLQLILGPNPLLRAFRMNNQHRTPGTVDNVA